MTYIELNKINIRGNRCEYEIDYPAEFASYIADTSKKLFFELPSGFDLESIPDGILAVPFVGSVLCVSMLAGVGIKVPVIDKTFFESIPHVKDTFKHMFPYADLCLDVYADKLVDCSYEAKKNPSVFFTGGVDATSALIEKIKEKPTLINIWGGDLLLSDTSGRAALERYISKLTSQIGINYVISKSNCRRFFNERHIEDRLSQILRPKDNHGWWASIAHILSMTSSIAPILYSLQVGVHYIGSGYTASSDEFDCNNVKMVNSIRVASCRFKMVDEDVCRSEKVQKIVTYCERNNLDIQFKVCWHSKASENCSHCEKCYRTIAELLSSHADPNRYGFRIDENGYRQMHQFIKYNYVKRALWEENKAAFLKEANYWKGNKNISWILDVDFNNKRRIEWHRMYCGIKTAIWKMTHQLFKKS